MKTAPDRPDTPVPSATGRVLELSEVRAKLAATHGPEYWRSLEELAQTPEFEELLYREFPQQASELPEGVDRRRFLQLAAASLALGQNSSAVPPPQYGRSANLYASVA